MLASLPSQQPNSDLASSSAALTTSPKGEPPPKSLSLRAKSQQTSPPLAFRVKREEKGRTVTAYGSRDLGEGDGQVDNVGGEPTAVGVRQSYAWDH